MYTFSLLNNHDDDGYVKVIRGQEATDDVIAESNYAREEYIDQLNAWRKQMHRVRLNQKQHRQLLLSQIQDYANCAHCGSVMRMTDNEKIEFFNYGGIICQNCIKTHPEKISGGLCLS